MGGEFTYPKMVPLVLTHGRGWLDSFFGVGTPFGVVGRKGDHKENRSYFGGFALSFGLEGSQQENRKPLWGGPLEKDTGRRDMAAQKMESPKSHLIVALHFEAFL